MIDFIHRLFANPMGPDYKGASGTSLGVAIERVVDGVDPRLRAVHQYRRILRRPVERTLEYLAESVDGLPAATPFDQARFASDPRLRALFVGPDHLLEILSYSPAVRGFLRHSRGAVPPVLYAAIRMERTEKAVLGMALDGDRVVRDVPQTTVSFRNHRIAFPAVSEDETRSLVRTRAFDYLIELARARLAGVRARRVQLEQQQRRLRLGVAGASGRGWSRRAERGRPESDGRLRMPGSDEAKLTEIRVELDELLAKSGTLGDQLGLVASMLREPRHCLRLDRVSLTLDQMNVKVSARSARAGHTLTFNELLIGSDRRVTLELIRFPSEQLLEPPDFLANAQRALARPS